MHALADPVKTFLTTDMGSQELATQLNPEQKDRFLELLKQHPIAVSLYAPVPEDWTEAVTRFKANVRAIHPMIDKLRLKDSLQAIVEEVDVVASKRVFWLLKAVCGQWPSLDDLDLEGQPFTECASRAVEAMENDERLKAAIVLAPNPSSQFMLKGEGHFDAPSKLDVLAPNLRVLRLPKLWIGRITPEIGNFSQLCELDLSGNLFTELPDSVGNLSQLRVLNLSKCGLLEQLPEAIGQLAELRQLLAKKSGLTQLPASTQQLTKLEKLDIRGTKIDPNAVEGMAEMLDRGVQLRLEQLPSTSTEARLASMVDGLEGLTDLLKQRSGRPGLPGLGMGRPGLPSFAEFLAGIGDE